MSLPEFRTSPSQTMTKRLKGFRYFSPTTVEQAVSILEEHKGTAKVLAGGTDLLPMMKLRITTPEAVVSLNKIAGLDYIREEGQTLRIGPLTTIAAILESDAVKRRLLSLHETAAGFATPQVRNMATIGGNICRSSPCANTPPPLMTFGAEVRLAGAKGERTVLLEDFFTGAGENVLGREVLTQIVVPLPGRETGAAFLQLTRNSSDLAKINCAVKLAVSDGKCEDVSVVLGSVADRPVRATKVEDAIRGKETTDEGIEEAARKAVENITPITDARSHAEYRAQVSKVLVARTMKLAIERAG